MPDPLASQPASEVAASVVLRQLGLARRALGRNDLHAFRVAVRRARTTLRAYRASLPDVRRKDRRRLRRLAQATNAGRDAEILLPLLERFGTDLGPAVRTELVPIRRRLRAARRSANAVGDDLRDPFERAARPLRRRLRRVPTSATSFGLVLGRLLVDDAPLLGGLLESLESRDDPDAVHAARLRVKRVRYLIEPVRREVPGAVAIASQLEGLQHALGDLHDLDVLSSLLGRDDPAPALSTLRSVVSAHRADRVREIRSARLGAHAATLIGSLGALGRRLGDRAQGA